MLGLRSAILAGAVTLMAVSAQAMPVLPAGGMTGASADTVESSKIYYRPDYRQRAYKYHHDAEIYRQRRYALFLSGTRWADERRFGRLAEARTTYLPYPAQETVGNPNPPTTP